MSESSLYTVSNSVFVGVRQFVLPSNDVTSDSSLESELCLALIHGKTSSITTVDVSGSSYRDIDLTNNLIINNLELETPNFIMKSKFTERDLSNSYPETTTYELGTNVFDSSVNSITKKINIDPSSSSFVDSTLEFTTTTNYGRFYNTADSSGSTWSLMFKNQTDDVLSLALNNQFNNNTEKSLVTTKENTAFNTNYAIANFDNQFNQWFDLSYDSVGSVSINNYTLPSNNQLSTNIITIDISKNILNAQNTTENFGTYQVYIHLPIIDVSAQSDFTNDISESVLPFYDQSNNPLPSTLTQVQYDSLFDGLTGWNHDNFTFQIEAAIDPSNEEGGYYPNWTTNNIDGQTGPVPFDFDNNTIIDNFNYMQGNYQNLNNEVYITQPIMNITDYAGSAASNNDSNILNFHLTTDGEKLNSSNYNLNGYINLSCDLTNNRVGQSGSSNMSAVNVFYQNDYNGSTGSAYGTYITGSQMTEKFIEYEVLHTLSTTGSGQYNSHLDSSGSSLYLSGVPDFSMNFTSNIDTLYNVNPSNIATYIEITVSTNLADNNAMYVVDASYNPGHSNDYTPTVGPIVPNAVVNVLATHVNINQLPYDEYREFLVSKQLSDLDLGLDVSGVLDGFQYLQGSNGLDPYLQSSWSSATQSFPTVEEIPKIVDGSGVVLPVNMLYTTVGQAPIPAFLFDQVIFSWNDLNTGNPNTLVLNQSDITFFNENPLGATYEIISPGTITNVGGPAPGNYTTYRVTFSENYQSRFKLPLAALTNAYVETPLINSTMVFYAVYNNLGPFPPATPPVHGAVNPTTFLPYWTIGGQGLQSTEVITRVSNGDPVDSILNLNIKSVTALLYKLQGIMNVDTTWTDLYGIDGGLYYDLDPYFVDQSSKEYDTYDSNNMNLVTNITPQNKNSTQHTLSLPSYSYQIPLSRNNATSDYSVSAYQYNISSILNFYPYNSGLSNPFFTPEFDIFNNQSNPNPAPVGTELSTSISVTYDYDSSGVPISITLTITDTNTSQVISTISAVNPGFVYNMTIFDVPLPVFQVVSNYGRNGDLILGGVTYAVQGDDTASQGTSTGISSGMVEVDSGVIITYNNVQQGNYQNFSLKTDLFYISVVGGNNSTSTNYITTLNYQYTTGGQLSELLTLDYYRGYDFSGHSQTNVQKFQLNRTPVEAYYRVNNNVFYVAQASYGQIWLNKTIDTNYNVCGSIGLDTTFNWSRFPSWQFNGYNPLVLNTLTIPINVYGDKVTITHTYQVSPLIETLKTPILWTFSDGTSIRSNRVRINVNSQITGVNNVEWTVLNHKSFFDVYYSPTYIGDPLTFVDYQLLNTLPIDQGVSGSYFNYNTLSPSQTGNLPFNIHLFESSLSGTTSYFVVAPPVYTFTQVTINAAKHVPFNVSNSSQYDPSQLVTTQAFIKSSNVINTYNPYTTDYPGVAPSNVNDIQFKQEVLQKSFTSFVDSPNSVVYDYIFYGTNIVISQYYGLAPSDTNPGTINTPIVIYNNTIDRLVNQVPTASNDFLSATKANEVYRVQYAQNLTPFDPSMNTDVNIIFRIHNQTLPPTTRYLDLVPAEGITLTLYDALPVRDSSNNYQILLNKFVAPAVDYTNLPANNITSIPFVISSAEKSLVNLPYTNMSTTPYGLPLSLNQVTLNDITVSGQIPWVPNTNPNLNPFNFNLTARDVSGQQLIVSLIGTNAFNLNVKYNYITTPDIFTVKNAAGSTIYRVNANGVISGQYINVNAVNLFPSTAFDGTFNNTTNSALVSYAVNSFMSHK